MKKVGAFEWTKTWAKIRGLQLDALESADSTNSLAKESKPAGTFSATETVGPIALTIAKVQLAGRGRAENEWTSAPGALLSSWTTRLSQPPQPGLSPLVGLALYEALDRTFPGLPFSLKAPNDVYLSNKKLAGLLIENVVTGSEVICVVGLGMNVTDSPLGVSASTNLGEFVEENELLSAWPRFLEAWFAELRTALAAGQNTKLDYSSRRSLVIALNRYPALSEPILEIDDRGQLKTATRTWFWHDL